MANIVTLQGPNPTQEIVSHFLDQYNQNSRFKSEQGMQQQAIDANNADHQAQLAELTRQYNDTNFQTQAKTYLDRQGQYKDQADATQDPNQKAAIQAQAKAELDNLKQTNPDVWKYAVVGSLEKVMTKQRQGDLNIATDRAQRTAPSTDPYNVAYTTKAALGAYPTTDMYRSAEATNLDALRASGAPTPDPTKAIPAPSSSFASNTAARDVGAMPTSTSDQTQQTSLTEEAMRQQGDTSRKAMEIAAKSGGGDASVPDMVKSLVTRQASLDDFAKKGTPLRNTLIQSMPQGTIAPSNEKERTDLVAANNTASLIYGRIQNIRKLASVVDDTVNRAAISSLLNASDSAFGTFLQGTVRHHVNPDVLRYVQEVRNLREDQFTLRKYLGNSPVRSDKQVNIMLSQSVGADAADGKDVNRMLDSFEPAVRQLVVGNQAAGAPMNPDTQQITTPDGLKWRKNPDGSMTQVQ